MIFTVYMNDSENQNSESCFCKAETIRTRVLFTSWGRVLKRSILLTIVVFCVKVKWDDLFCFWHFLCIYKLIRISIIDWAEWVKLTLHFCPSSASRKAKIRSNFLINLKTFWWMSIIINNVWKSSTDAFSIIGMKVLHI